MNKTIISALALASAAVPASANAAVSLWNGTGADTSFSWGQLGPAFAVSASGTTAVATNGNVVTVTDSDGTFQRRDQGNGWAGNFAPGEQLLFTGEPGTLLLTFANPVQAAGAQIQADLLFGSFTARITSNDGNFVDISGLSSNAGADGNPFLGIISDSADISSILFSVQNGTDGFAISQLNTIGGATRAIPEPGTWVMLLGGFGAVGVAMCRRRRLAGQATA